MVEKAPIPSNLDWKNLAYDRQHRISRKITIGMFLLIFSFAVVYPFNFLLAFLPIRVGNDNKIVNSSEDQWYVTVIALYFLPVILFAINYLLMPLMVFKLIFYENNHQFSGRELSIMNKCYIYMVFNCLFLPGFTWTISLRFV